MIPKVKYQGFFSMIVIYLGIGLGYVNLILIMPKYFSLEELGLRSLLIDFVSVFYQICIIGFSSSTIKFFPSYKEKNEEGFLAFIFLIPLANFLLFSLLLFFARDLLFDVYANSPLFVRYYYLIFPLTLFFISSVLLEAHLKNYYKIFVPNFLKEFFPRFLLLLLLIITIYGCFDRAYFWWAFVSIYAIEVVFLLLYTIYLKKYYIKIKWELINKVFLKKVLSYSLYTVLNSTVIMLFYKFDVLMIGAQLSLREVGIYATMIYIATVIEIPKRVLTQFASPQIAVSWHSNDLNKLGSYYIRYSKMQFVLSGVVFLMLYFGLADMFEILPKKAFSEGALVLVFLLITKLILSAFGPVNEIISFSEKYRINLVFNFISCVLAITLNYFFIEKWGMEGAAIATVISITFSLVIKAWYIYMKFKLFPFTIESIKIFVVFILVLFTKEYFYEFENSYLSIIYKSIVVGSVFIGGLYLLKLLKVEDFNFKD